MLINQSIILLAYFLNDSHMDQLKYVDVNVTTNFIPNFNNATDCVGADYLLKRITDMGSVSAGIWICYVIMSMSGVNMFDNGMFLNAVMVLYVLSAGTLGVIQYNLENYRICN